jgi:ABC-2 type transport system ATP-binding protein
VIEVEGLGKTFTPPGGLRDLLRGRLRGLAHTALASISFAVAPGEVLAVVGANGAGKTTLLRVLAGLLTPTTGRVVVAGQNVAAHGTASDFRRRIALIVADERSFMWSLSGRENLRFFAALHGLGHRRSGARCDQLLARVGLAADAHRRYSDYSRGMRQRLSLARGLLGDPEVLLLDEPTLGLDPVGAREMRRFLRDEIIKGHGRTAVVGSNDPAEVQLLADRVLYLKGGRHDGEGAPGDLARRLGLAGLDAGVNQDGTRA